MNADQSYAARCIAPAQSQPETIAMNVSTTQRATFHSLMLPAIVATALLFVPHPAQAATADADADSGQTVECMLPGQIHTVGGHVSLGPRRPIQATPADCRQRGGEYTVDERASQPQTVSHVPMASADDGRVIACLLPRQVRQLGEKARYTRSRRTIHTTRTDCQARGGDVIVPEIGRAHV